MTISGGSCSVGAVMILPPRTEKDASGRYAADRLAASAVARCSQLMLELRTSATTPISSRAGLNPDVAVMPARLQKQHAMSA